MRTKAWVVGVMAALLRLGPIASAAATPLPPALSPHLGLYQYFSPIPGSRLVSPWNNIVIRHGGVIDPGTVEGRMLSVVGSTSGVHTGRLTLLDDRKTLIFDPDIPFALGETVDVRLGVGLRALGGEGLPTLSYSFSVSATDPKQQPPPRLDEIFPGLSRQSAAAPLPAVPLEIRKLLSVPCDTLPSGAPTISVLDSSDPNAEDLFIAPFYAGIPGAYLLIVDHWGMPIYCRTFPDGYGALDFKRQPNGLLTYFLGGPGRYYVMDDRYAVIDSFAAGNGYPTDLHELQLLPDGHALLMSYDPEPVDMSAVVPGGNPNAWVTGLIVQEIDESKNVVFQWRSWDHFAITDLVSPDIALTDSVIDYVHGNAIEPDHDGNLLISSRHLNEITKIDPLTGDIIWRLGLNAVNNQFSFVNDSRGFSHQHDIRRLPNGHITLFDNGNFLSPQYSRAAEYDLDEVNKVATLVWEYRNTPDVYGGFMGNTQRHADGTTTIGWGGSFANLKLSDIHADGSKALGMGIEDSFHTWWSYRSFRFPWKTTRFVTDPDLLDFDVVGVGNTGMRPLSIRNTSGSDVTIGCFITTDPAFTVTNEVPFVLPPGGSATVNVEFAPADPGEHDAALYVRQVGDNELVAQAVAMRGIADGTTAVTRQGASGFGLEASRPNPFSRATAIEFTLARPGIVRLAIFDVHGRKVETLVDGVRPAGSYEATWTSKNRASGIYFCRLEAGGLVETRRLVLMN